MMGDVVAFVIRDVVAYVNLPPYNSEKVRR
jgi:hypothetical protein